MTANVCPSLSSDACQPHVGDSSALDVLSGTHDVDFLDAWASLSSPVGSITISPGPTPPQSPLDIEFDATYDMARPFDRVPRLKSQPNPSIFAKRAGDLPFVKRTALMPVSIPPFKRMRLDVHGNDLNECKNIAIESGAPAVTVTATSPHNVVRKE
jgi:hypothetical protein